MGILGRKASEALDNARPQGLVGKAVVAAAKGVRAVDRKVTTDPHNRTNGDPTLCHMRARKNGKECGNKLTAKQIRNQEGHCGHRICANEYIAYTSDPNFNEYRDSTHRQVKRW